METKKHRDGTVSIRLNYSDLCALQNGFYEKRKDCLEQSKKSDSEYIAELYTEWAEIAEQKMRETSELFHWAIEQQDKINKTI